MGYYVGLPLKIMSGDGTAAVTQRAFNNINVAFTNLKAIRLRLYGTTTSTMTFDEVFESVAPATNLSYSVKNLINGRVAIPIYVNSSGQRVNFVEYALDIDLLPANQYVFTMRKQAPLWDYYNNPVWQKDTIKLFVDRAAPIAQNLTYSTSKLYIGTAYGSPSISAFPGGAIKVPNNMFGDDVSASADLLTVVSVVPLNDPRGFGEVPLLVPSPAPGRSLSNLYIGTAGIAVRKPAGSVDFNITVRDEAGNLAWGIFTLPIVERAAPSLVVSDARNIGQMARLYTGSASTLSPAGCTAGVDCNVILTVIATYDEAVYPLNSTDLRLTTLTGSRTAYSSSQVSMSSSNRVYRFAVTLPSVRHNDSYLISIDAGVTSTLVAGMSSGASSNNVIVSVDLQGPTIGSAPTKAPIKAAVNVPYIFNFSTTFFTDSSGSPDDRIYLKSADPPSIIGLRFIPGFQGLAQVTGSAFQRPVSGNVTMVITGADEAGNTVSRPLVIDIAAPIEDLRISFASTPLKFVEKSVPVVVDPLATFTWTDNLNSADIYLIGGAEDTLSGGSYVLERLTATAPGTATVSQYVIDPITGAGKITVACPNGGTAGCMSPSDVQNLLQSITYSNNFTDPLVGGRRVEVRLFHFDGFMVSAFSRLVTVIPVNDPPVISTTVFTSSPWVESSSLAVANAPRGVFTSVTITDPDDTMMTSASVKLDVADASGSYKHCDKSRDRLQLLSNYNGALAPDMMGQWDVESCTLVVSPVSGGQVTIAQMQTALMGVQYINLNERDPSDKVPYTGSFPPSLIRGVTLTVQDAGGKSSGLDRTGMTSLTGTVTLQPYDDPPALNYAMMYATGGVFSSSDPFALVGKVRVADLRQRKLIALKPAGGSDTIVSTFPMNLMKVSSGVFANGAITDVDSNDPPASGVTMSYVSSSGLATPLVTFATTATGFVTGSWDYSVSGLSNFSLTLNSMAIRGEYMFRLHYGAVSFSDTLPPTVDFLVDVREKACTLTGASNYALTIYPLAAIEEFYPDNANCVFAPVQFNGSAPLTVDRGNFLEQAADMASKVASLEASNVETMEKKVEALAEERAKAKGSFKLDVDKGAASAINPIPLTAVPPDPVTVALIPPLPKKTVDKQEVIDPSAMLHLGPACTSFAKPVQICMFGEWQAALPSNVFACYTRCPSYFCLHPHIISLSILLFPRLQSVTLTSPSHAASRSPPSWTATTLRGATGHTRRRRTCALTGPLARCAATCPTSPWVWSQSCQCR